MFEASDKLGKTKKCRRKNVTIEISNSQTFEKTDRQYKSDQLDKIGVKNEVKSKRNYFKKK